MAIMIKSASEIELMREACRITGEGLRLLESLVAPGITTKELDDAVVDFLKKNGATATFLGYGGYPASVCISVNEEVIHGIPGKRRLIEGDIVSFDFGARINGFTGDAARTVGVGKIDPENERLIKVARESFFKGIEFAKPGCYVNDVSSAIGGYIEESGFSPVKEWTGHGVGRNLHEDPEVPNYRLLRRGPKLSSGMTLAIEPMVNVGGFKTQVLADEWTVVTADGTNSAHYENTVLITENGPELLTLYEEFK